MAMVQELNINIQEKLSEESKGSPTEKIREYEPVDGVKWRFGTPNYARVNKMYFDNRLKIHQAGSLEDVVTKLVKKWEVESHHIADPKQWQTMDVSKFEARLNGGAAANAQTMADIGPYNLLIQEHSLYSGAANSFESANTLWSGCFSEGFAWECLEVLSGPPTVTFKWRHFGKFTGTYTDLQGNKFNGNGEMINVIGLCIAKVTESLVIESLDVYYNPDDLLKPITAACYKDTSVAPVGGDEADKQQEAKACGCQNGAAGCSVM